MGKIIHGGDIKSFKDKYNENPIDFSANISPLLLPENIKKVIADNIDSICEYPDPFCRDLIEDLSKYHKVDREKIVVGNGAADVIFRIVLAKKPKKALILAPTFAEYQRALSLVDAQVEYYNLREEDDFCITENILDRINDDMDMLFICNPNNPTGQLIEKELLIKIATKCDECNCLLVVDECFIDFTDTPSDNTLIEDINKFDNLVILKAFTKMYALAGLRLGYAIGQNTELIEDITNASQVWSVSTLAQLAGIQALKESDYVRKVKKIIKEERKYLYKELLNIGIKAYKTSANYIFFQTDEIDLDKKLEQKGILIRNCSNYINLKEGYFRIAGEVAYRE